MEQHKVESFTLRPQDREETTETEFSGSAEAQYVLDNGRVEIYRGNFKKGLKEGRGQYIFYDGSKYDGEYHNNEREGIGAFTLKSSAEERYAGNYVCGLREGQGFYLYKNGDSYTGWWYKGKRHGRGVYIFARDKSKLEGIFHEGSFARGIWKVLDNCYFAGEFENNPIGRGMWVTRGHQVFGTYESIKPTSDDEKTTEAPRQFTPHNNGIATFLQLQGPESSPLG